MSHPEFLDVREISYVPLEIHSPLSQLLCALGRSSVRAHHCSWMGTIHRDHRQQIRKDSKVEVFIPLGPSLWGHQGQAVPINQRSQCHLGGPVNTALFLQIFSSCSLFSPFQPLMIAEPSCHWHCSTAVSLVISLHTAYAFVNHPLINSSS